MYLYNYCTYLGRTLRTIVVTLSNQAEARQDVAEGVKGTRMAY